VYIAQFWQQTKWLTKKFRQNAKNACASPILATIKRAKKIQTYVAKPGNSTLEQSMPSIHSGDNISTWEADNV
jgi:hypothetical protein